MEPRQNAEGSSAANVSSGWPISGCQGGAWRAARPPRITGGRCTAPDFNRAPSRFDPAPRTAPAPARNTLPRCPHLWTPSRRPARSLSRVRRVNSAAAALCARSRTSEAECTTGAQPAVATRVARLWLPVATNGAPSGARSAVLQSCTPGCLKTGSPNSRLPRALRLTPRRQRRDQQGARRGPRGIWGRLAGGGAWWHSRSFQRHGGCHDITHPQLTSRPRAHIHPGTPTTPPAAPTRRSRSSSRRMPPPTRRW
jgi:hypothetical protein